MLLKVPPSVSKHRTLQLTKYFGDLIDSPEPLKILDVGCGHAFITREIMKRFPHFTFTGVDVLIRPGAAIEVVKYDGTTLPFEDKSFDIIFMIDMLHHADDPVQVLKECGRVAKRFILLKDHVSDSYYDQKRLEFMDWFGNRPFGIPMTYNYFSSKQWEDAFEKAGVVCEKMMRGIHTCPAPFYYIFDHDVHLLAKLVSKK